MRMPPACLITPGGWPIRQERTDMSSLPHEEAARILCRVLEALARQSGKTLSAKTRGEVERACELLSAGDDYSDLLDDLLSAPPVVSDRQTVSFEREDYGDPNFRTWRAQR
jgi:hypothetical protein